jgi:CheY-like chemotaxis protein
MGASDYLSKPIDWRRLLTVLDKFRSPVAPPLALVVEDDADTREMLRRNLEKNGWEVAQADNGLVALCRVLERAPSVILLDLMMPEMDGFEFVRELRQRDPGRNIPIVVITARHLTEEDDTQLNGQVIQILEKGSLRTEELLCELQRLLPPAAAKSST